MLELFLPLELQKHKFMWYFHQSQQETAERQSERVELFKLTKRIWIHFWQLVGLMAAYLHQRINIQSPKLTEIASIDMFSFNSVKSPVFVLDKELVAVALMLWTQLFTHSCSESKVRWDFRQPSGHLLLLSGWRNIRSYLSSDLSQTPQVIPPTEFSSNCNQTGMDSPHIARVTFYFTAASYITHAGLREAASFHKRWKWLPSSALQKVLQM